MDKKVFVLLTREKKIQKIFLRDENLPLPDTVLELGFSFYKMSL